MCGIAGYYCYDAARPSVREIKGLWLANESRGRSASGIAYINDGGTMAYRKRAEPVSWFLGEGRINADGWAEIARSPRALLHARATTKGSEKDNENNHPVIGHNWAVVHNGHVTNDDDLFAYYSPEARFAAVDTASIPLVLSQGGTDLEKSLQHLTLLGGNATLAAWSTQHLDTIALARLGHNDLWLFWDEHRHILFWSSAGSASYALSGPKLGNVKFLNIGKLGDDKILILRPGDNTTEGFAVRRSPFVLPVADIKKAMAAATAATGSGSTEAPSSACGSNAGPSGSSRTGTSLPMANAALSSKTGSPQKDSVQASHIKWERYTKSSRPEPITSFGDKGLTPVWHNFIRCCQIAAASKTLDHEILAGYGRWLFRLSNGKADIAFFPYKRTKTWWRKLPKGHPNVVLPAEIEDRNGRLVTALDDLSEFEGFILVHHLVGGSEFQTPGLMCPWCGVCQPSSAWSEKRWRCEFCNVKSLLHGGS